MALDLPLGSHLTPIGDGVDPTPTGLADLIADAIEALGLDDVTLVGNDTGGALCQIWSRGARSGWPARAHAMRLPRRLSPQDVRLLQARRPASRRAAGYAGSHAAAGFAIAAVRLRLAGEAKIDRPAEDSYVYPALVTPAVLAELRRILLALDKSYTNEAADRLGSFTKPSLIAWAREDRLFKPANGEALARDLGNARLEWIDDSRTFVSEDNPDRLAELIAGFARRSDRHANQRRSSRGARRSSPRPGRRRRTWSRGRSSCRRSRGRSAAWS